MSTGDIKRAKASPRSQITGKAGKVMRGKHLTEPEGAIQDLGVKVTMHDLRRTFANETLSAAHDARRVKLALNHSITGDVTWENFANAIKPKLGQLRAMMTEQEERIRLIVEGVPEAQDGPTEEQLLEALKSDPRLLASLLAKAKQ